MNNKILDEILKSSDIDFIIKKLSEINLEALSEDSLSKLSEHLQKFIKLIPLLKKVVSRIAGIGIERKMKKIKLEEEQDKKDKKRLKK